MKKLLITCFMLLGLVTLYGCGEKIDQAIRKPINNLTDQEKNSAWLDTVSEAVSPKQEEQKQISQDDIFEKNLKCQEYLDSYQEWSEHIASPAKPLGVTIFYSPIENSCMGYFSTLISSGLPYDENYENYTEYYITSAFDRSHDWSLYSHNTYNKGYLFDPSKKTWCDRVSAFGMPSNEAGFLFDEDCNNMEELRWNEINYLKGN